MLLSLILLATSVINADCAGAPLVRSEAASLQAVATSGGWIASPSRATPPSCAGEAASESLAVMPGSGTYWFPLRVEPASEAIEIAVRVLGSADVCILWPTWNQLIERCGEAVAGRGLTHQFAPPARVDWQQPIWIRLTGVVLAPPEVVVGSRSRIEYRERRSEIGFGVYYGVLLAIALLACVVYLSQRHVAYLWFAAFLASLTGTVAGFSGRGLGLLTQLPGNWLVLAPLVGTFVTLLALSGFAVAYLRIERHRERLSWLLLRGAAVAALCGVAIAPWLRERMLVPAALLAAVTALTVLAVAAMGALQRRRRARYMLAASAILLAGVVLAATHVLVGSYAGLGYALLLIIIGSLTMPATLVGGVYRRFRELADERDQARSELVAAQRLALLRAHYCRITGLPRRHKLAEMFQRLTARGGERLRVGVYLIHVDNLNELRQRHGRSALEHIITTIAGRLRDGLDERQLLGRLEDWELVVLVPSEIEGEAVRQRLYEAAERITACVEQPLKVADESVLPSVSVGLAVWPLHGEGFDELVRRCDSALYDAQSEGGNRIRIYSEEAFRARASRWERINALRGALDSNALELHYQPIHSAATGDVHGFEALLRWRDEDGRLVLPGEFVPLAEDSDLIIDVGYYVLATAIEDLRWLRARGVQRPFISLNISPRQLSGETFVMQLRSLLERAELSPDSLHLEITETRLIDNWERTRQMLRRIRRAGVRVYVDDFGVGYSSLSYLRELPIHGLKIDRSFVSRIGRTEQDEAVLSAMLRLAHSLNLDIVAEGVETEQQRQFLLDRKCRMLQGHLYSIPLVREAILDYLADEPDRGWVRRFAAQLGR